MYNEMLLSLLLSKLSSLFVIGSDSYRYIPHAIISPSHRSLLERLFLYTRLTIIGGKELRFVLPKFVSHM